MLQSLKQQKRKIVALTAYNYSIARLLDESECDLILCGDSLGMVELGYPDTTSVTLEDMLHHTRAVARGIKQKWLISDLPSGTYKTAESALDAARRLKSAGAHGVKAEGGIEISDAISAIVQAGIPYVGHLGMLPQRVREEGGYRIKGKTENEAEQLIADAKLLERLGASAIVLELVTPQLAKQISDILQIPTIGIGSGNDCDGQILVTYDLIGLFPWFRPAFVKPRADIAPTIREAIQQFSEEVRK